MVRRSSCVEFPLVGERRKWLAACELGGSAVGVGRTEVLVKVTLRKVTCDLY